MKTKLPKEILNVHQAKLFLSELHRNVESFHPEDDATDINWQLPEEDMPSISEAKLLNKLMEEIYNLPGNKGHRSKLLFDPCKYLLDLDAQVDHCTQDRHVPGCKCKGRSSAYRKLVMSR